MLLCLGSAFAGEGLSRGRRQALARQLGFQPVAVFKLDDQIGPLQLADFNGDGHDDLLLIVHDRLLLYRGQ